MLRWPDLDRVPPALRPVLLGPGAPFELVRAKVRGVEMTVFAQRHRDLVAVLAEAARDHPDRPYLVRGDRALTYAEAARSVPALAAVLRRRHGVRPGDRVALAGANSPEHALTMWAVITLGAVVVGLNAWWAAPELAYGLELTQPHLLVADGPRLARLTGTREPTGNHGSSATSAGDIPATSFAALFAAADDQPTSRPAGLGAGTAGSGTDTADRDEDDAVAILFTSGTTGRPKGALVSHRGLINFGLDTALRGAVEVVSGAAPAAQGPPVSLLVGPFFHISGLGLLLSAAPRSGMTLVLSPPGRWDPAVHLDLTARHGVNQWSGVPTQILRLLDQPGLGGLGAGAIRTIGCGGAAAPPGLSRAVARLMPGTVVTSGYGMTETCGIGTAVGGPLLAAHPGAAGVPTPTTELMIREPDGTEITGGGTGEIWLRSPSTFLGYWRDEAASGDVLDPDGWYRTGDFGRIKDDLLYVESRLRDLIIRGGENIYPIEIENRLLDHPDIADAAVIGVPHRELGQEVMAVIVPRDGATADGRTVDGAAVDSDGVRRWVAAGLAPFKVPAHVRFVAALPYGATGKVHKLALEERFGTGGARAQRDTADDHPVAPHEEATPR